MLSRVQGLRAAGGYSFIELATVTALIGVLAAITVPTILSSIEAEKIRGAAREVVALMNQARQLAVTQNIPYSIEGQTTPQNRLRFCSSVVNPCPGGTVWVDAATDPNGWIAVENGVLLVLAPPITFTALGAATPAGRLRVQQPQGTSCLDVVVSASGRVQIVTSPSCP